MSETGARGQDRSVAVGPLWWPRPRSVVLDVVLTLVAIAECVLQSPAFAARTGLPLPLVLTLSTLAGAVLIVRRRWPIAPILVAIAILPANMGSLHAVVGLYTLATLDVSRRLIASLTGMTIMGSMIVMYFLMVPDEPIAHTLPWWFLLLTAGMFGLLHGLPPVLLGMYVGARRRLVESLRERADGMERELSLLADRAEERADWARREERTRIARDMHDVVAHRVSLMVVHAAALQAVVHKDPEKASSNAALVGDMGRQALTELRTMLGVLRSDETGAAAAPRRPDPASRLAEIAGTARGGGPSGSGGPRLEELADLIGQSRAAGMTVRFTEDGSERRYAPPVERTAFRVVQEGLTNVHKHAAGAATTVRLARRDGEVAVQVQNEPPPREPDGQTPPAGLPSGGNGLVGMRERVTALGGAFVSGATADGGFRVSAVIPDPQAREPEPQAQSGRSPAGTDEAGGAAPGDAPTSGPETTVPAPPSAGGAVPVGAPASAGLTAPASRTGPAEPAEEEPARPVAPASPAPPAALAGPADPATGEAQQ